MRKPRSEQIFSALPNCGLMHRSKSKRGSATAIVALGKRFGRGTFALVLQTTKPPTEAARNFKSGWVGLGRPVRPV
jgi:hypothetical protein